MKRRTTLAGLAICPLALRGAVAAESRGAATVTPDEIGRRVAERRAQALASFPYERVEVDGSEALAAVERLRASGRGWPVVVGGDDELASLAEQIAVRERSPAELLKAAAGLFHPRDLLAHQAEAERGAEEAFEKLRAARAPDEQDRLPRGRDYVLDVLRGLGIVVEPLDARLVVGPREPRVGTWPSEPPWLPWLTVAYDRRGNPHHRVHIVVLPTGEGASVPAYLGWGGWNTNPPAEYHVAALRSWRTRYGAELVGVSSDVMNLKVSSRPATRDEALALAREQYEYCSDIVDQGDGTLAALASMLMSSDWWYFWWD
jgi:hypothetical protein